MYLSIIVSPQAYFTPSPTARDAGCNIIMGLKLGKTERKLLLTVNGGRIYISVLTACLGPYKLGLYKVILDLCQNV